MEINENKLPPKYVYDRVDIAIPVGSLSFFEPGGLREGKCMGIRVIPIQNKDPEYAINVGVEDTSGNELASLVDFRDYSSTGGGHSESYKEVGFYINGNVNVKAFATQNITGSDFVAQVIFKIDINCRR